jgi:hypothetical protein
MNDCVLFFCLFYFRPFDKLLCLFTTMIGFGFGVRFTFENIRLGNRTTLLAAVLLTGFGCDGCIVVIRLEWKCSDGSLFVAVKTETHCGSTKIANRYSSESGADVKERVTMCL